MEFEVMSNNKLKKLKQENDREDRLSDLHDDLLLEILSFLPTKDAVATCVLSRRWSHVCKLLGRLEFVQHYSDSTSCFNVEAFGKFKGFVDSVLQKLSDSQNVTSFKLKFCEKYYNNPIYELMLFYYIGYYKRGVCVSDKLKAMNINSWLSYPLNHGGIKEVDISFHLMGFPINKVPLGYFNCPTLEVLKLDGNFAIEVPLCLKLPVLKELFLRLHTFPDDDESIARLVSSCPLLQHLSLIGEQWSFKNSINICAKYLRSLVIRINTSSYAEDPRSKFVLDVPNLENLLYHDNMAFHYLVGEMNAIIEAHLDVLPVSFHLYSEHNPSPLSKLMSSLSNVRSLSLSVDGIEALECGFVELPVFGKLKYLELGNVMWAAPVMNKTLLKLLNSTPLLETLSFPGIFTYDINIFKEEHSSRMGMREVELWKNAQTIPTCLSVSLKRIMMKKYQRSKWELQVVKYFLRSSLVLEQLRIVCDIPVAMEDKIELQTTLQNLPILSPNCSIIVD